MRRDFSALICLVLLAASVACPRPCLAQAGDLPGGPGEVERLFADACDPSGGPNSEKSVGAKRSLIELGPGAMDCLVAHLGTQDPREIAVLEDVVAGIGAPAVPALAGRLEFPDDPAAAQAARLLGSIGNGSAAAVPPLCALATSGRAWIVRSNAVAALGAIGDTQACDTLLSVLSDRAEPVRREAAVALGKLKQPMCVKPLIGALADRFFSVRSAAADALVSVAQPPAEPQPATTPVTPTAGGGAPEAAANPRTELAKLLEPFAAQGAERTGEFSEIPAALAVETLGRLREPKSAALLRKLLGSSDWGIRAAAAEALAQVDSSPATRQALQKALAAEKHHLVRRKLEDAIGNFQK
ncbi:MAG: HEAT repeat domain-containing protein [Planctomycetota bacterium]|nr:HEAT repeat domain-containing protein [Planctomycetota bacterium]